MKSQSIIFHSDLDDDKKYIQWFNVNERPNKAVFSGWENSKSEDTFLLPL